MKHDINSFQRDLEEDAGNRQWDHIAHEKANGSQFRNSFVRVSYHSNNYLDTREQINSQRESIRPVLAIRHRIFTRIVDIFTFRDVNTFVFIARYIDAETTMGVT